VLFVLFISRSGMGVKKGSMIGKRDYSPVSWDHYFEKMSDIKVDNDVSLNCKYLFILFVRVNYKKFQLF